MTAELRSIDFHGEVVFLISRPEDGKPFVPVKPLCSQLGMAWQPQHRKLVSDEDLWGCHHMVIPSPDGPQTMTCLPLENLNGWLFSIQAARVKPEFRERLRTYQKECFQVLDAYWRTGAAIRPEVRAAAPEATRALFEEIEGMTGLNPEAAQPGTEAYTWVSTSEAARRLGVGRTLVQYRIAAASIPTRQVGPFRLVPLEALQANLERDPVNTGVGCKAVKPGSFPTGELLRELRELLGDEGTRSALHRMWPAFFPEGGAQ